MKILMISIDKGLLGKNPMGDVIERHREYGEFCNVLDIIVFNNCSSIETKKYNYKISENITAYPTNSDNRLKYIKDGLRIAEKLFKENSYDLVVCQTPFLTGWLGAKLKKKFKTKLLVHFHGDFWDDENWLKLKWYNKFLLLISKKVVKKSDVIRVVSKGIKQKLIKRGVNKDRIHIISTPVDLKKFEKFNSEKVEQYKKEFQGKNILFIGRLEPVKNLLELLDVFKNVLKKYRDVNLIIGGTGSLEEKLRSKVKKLDLENNVKFLGRVDHDDLSNFLHFCDFLVLPSVSESFGKTLIEANACSKAVVASATTGASEIITDGENGFIIPIHNKTALQDKILELLNNPKLAEKMGINGKKLVKDKFGDNTQKIIDLWKKIIK